jgi:hypothetical protein
MGGLYGNAAATALEDVPFEARGLISGMLQQGYAFGYLLAVVFARGLVDTTRHGWRPLFWFGFVDMSSTQSDSNIYAEPARPSCLSYLGM